MKRRRRKNLPSGRMFHGRSAAEDGRLYTPTHSTKGGRRYFYYTLLVDTGRGSTRSARRLPAAEVEARVVDAVSSFLEGAPNIAGHFLVSPDELRLPSTFGRQGSTILRVRMKRCLPLDYARGKKHNVVAEKLAQIPGE